MLVFEEIYPTPQSYDKLLTQIKGTVAFFDFFQNEAKPSEQSNIPPDIQEYNIQLSENKTKKQRT